MPLIRSAIDVPINQTVERVVVSASLLSTPINGVCYDTLAPASQTVTIRNCPLGEHWDINYSCIETCPPGVQWKFNPPHCG
jgi:hypothetical protein